jgi:hypothetical protein
MPSGRHRRPFPSSREFARRAKTISTKQSRIDPVKNILMAGMQTAVAVIGAVVIVGALVGFVRAQLTGIL